MATTYVEAEQDVIDLANEVIDQYYPDIRRCSPEPVISILMAENEDGNALKKFGAGVVAMIKRSTKEDKAENGPDLRILIDAGKWANASERRRMAIMAHEIRHVEIQWQPGGMLPKIHDYGRPKIKLIPDDWVLTGFSAVARWFGDDAVEVQAVRSVHESLKQLGLPFMDADQSAVIDRVAQLDREAEADRDDEHPGEPQVTSVTLTSRHFDVAATAAKTLRRSASAG